MASINRYCSITLLLKKGHRYRSQQLRKYTSPKDDSDELTTDDKQIKEYDIGKHEDKKPIEIGGPTGPEPTRYGDWERKGRVTDF